jgi:hypothetical protein
MTTQRWIAGAMFAGAAALFASGAATAQTKFDFGKREYD